MSEFNPVLSYEEFKVIGIFDEKPQVMPYTVRVYLGTERCTVFTSGSNITRSELMAGKYSSVYVIQLREYQKTYEQALGSADDLAGFTAKITLSVRISKPDVYVRSMIKDVIRLIQQKMTPYLETISMRFSPEKSLDLQREFVSLLDNTNFCNKFEKEYGIQVNVDSILIRPDARALELIQQNRRLQDEHVQALKKMEENFSLQMTKQRKEVEMQLAEMEHLYEIKSKEAALKLIHQEREGKE